MKARASSVSTTNLQPLTSNLCLSKPAHDCDARAAADFRLDLENVYEPLRAGQPLAQAAARREAVAHRGGDIWDAGAFVLEDEPEARAPLRAVERLRDHAPAPRVLDDVAGEFGRDRR